MCLGCYFYESGYMWNRCNFFEMEYFCEPEECEAFSVEDIPVEEARKIYERILGED